MWPSPGPEDTSSHNTESKRRNKTKSFAHLTKIASTLCQVLGLGLCPLNWAVQKVCHNRSRVSRAKQSFLPNRLLTECIYLMYPSY